MEPTNKINRITPFKPFIDDPKGLRLAYINSNILLTKDERDEYFNSKDRKRNKKIIVSASIAAGLGVISLGAGVPKLRSLMNKGIKVLERELRSVTNKENLMLTDRIIKTSISFVLNIFQRVKALGNIVPIRDYWVGELLNKIKPTRVASNWITSAFESKTIKVTKKKIKVVANACEMLRHENKKILHYLEKNPSKDKIIKHPYTGREIKTSEFLKEQMRVIEKEVDKYFYEFDNIRLKRIQDLTSKSRTKLNKTKFKAKDYTTNIADGLWKEEQAQLNKELHELKTRITSDVKEKLADVTKEIDEVNSFLKRGTNKERAVLSDIKKLSKYYTKPRKFLNKETLNTAEKEEARHLLQEQISGKIKELLNETKKRKSNDQGLYDAIKKLDKLNNKMTDKGLVEDLSLASKVFDPKDAYMYKEFKEKRENFKNVFASAIKNEGNKLFSKLRDLNIGSAPTDIIGQALPVIAVGSNIATAKDKKERVSSTFKGGIPVLGGIGATLFATLKQVNSFGSLVLGIVVGMVLNKAGKLVVKGIYPKNRNNQQPKTYVIKSSQE